MRNSDISLRVYNLLTRHGFDTIEHLDRTPGFIAPPVVEHGPANAA
ncbi:MAG: hypothetical protein R2849_16955 [Thermomicrobiales bacterium]